MKRIFSEICSYFTKNSENPSKTALKKGRVVVLSLFLAFLFSLIIIQFFRLQITEHEHWERMAQKQHFFILKQPFHRGTFYSDTSLKKGHPEAAQKFVVEIEKFHLYIDPESIPEQYKKNIAEEIIKKLASHSVDKKKVFSDFFKKSRSRKLAMWLDSELKEDIYKWWVAYAKKCKIPLNALYFASDYQRSYPFGKLLGQVLHTVQSIKDEKNEQSLPTGGLELAFNEYLKGKPGKRRLMRSPKNHLETGEILSLPENGSDIHLTINHNIQAIAEEEIEKGVKKCGAKSGWAVMMNPHTGEILALAQYPFFDPRNYQEYYKNPALIESTKVKAITDANEPGSVIKPINYAIALKANLIKPIFNPDEMINTQNGHFKGRSKPVRDTRMHKYLNMDMAVQKSSNVYPAIIVDRIVKQFGAAWYRKELEAFGLGKKTKIELPGETKGVIPTIGKKHPNGTLEWSDGTPPSLSMGYNLQLNTLQILRAHAAIANGGFLVEPTIIKKIEKNGSVVFDNAPSKKTFPRILPESIANRVKRAMKYTTKPGGTARKADVWGYTEAGKTSTSHKIVNGAYSEKKHISNFIGFTPVKNPKFILIITMDEPEYKYIPGIGKTHHGGTAAAPVFREIARRTLEYLGAKPDDVHGYPMQDPRFDKDKADHMVETRRLQEMYEKWNNSSKE